MVKEERKTIKNKFTSSRTSKARVVPPKINIEERYCAKTITGILYPRTTENKLIIFITKSLFLRLVIVFLMGIKTDKLLLTYSL